MQDLRALLRRFAQARGAILLQGETGTGKELCAEYLQRQIQSEKFVALNCGAIPKELVEAELFGSRVGAFTGARDRQGLFHQANDGVLFLDEIGDLPLSAQTALLRVLETRRVRPVGGEHDLPARFRLICATHHDLKERVNQGLFRSDLYHRLAILVVQIPPLRERLEDLPILARALIGVEVDRLSFAAWRALKVYSWPGNVRELRNVLLRALASSDAQILPQHLQLPEECPKFAQKRPLKQRVAQIVSEVLKLHQGNVRATARSLEVSPTTIYRYMELERREESLELFL